MSAKTGSMSRLFSEDKLSRQMMKQRRSVASLSGSVIALNRIGDYSILTTGRKSVIGMREVC